MSKHDNDTCPHLVRASLLEAENARLKAEVERLKNNIAYLDRKLDEELDKGGKPAEGMIEATWVVSEQDAERIKARLEREKRGQP